MAIRRQRDMRAMLPQGPWSQLANVQAGRRVHSRVRIYCYIPDRPDCGTEFLEVSWSSAVLLSQDIRVIFPDHPCKEKRMSHSMRRRVLLALMAAATAAGLSTAAATTATAEPRPHAGVKPIRA